MPDMSDGTNLPPHGMFFMESEGGYHATIENADEKHQPGCFGLEEEKGKSSPGIKGARPLLVESRPTL